jgi:hypothetical protein
VPIVILTVTTMKDSLTNVRRYVEGNLAGGADHLMIFLDAPDPEVEAWLAERPEVTFVVTDRSWWQDNRPKLLNKRQRVNANLARAVLTRIPAAEWVFHVDADEIVRIDRDALAAVPADRAAVGLEPMEVVSEMHPDGEPRLFKRLLEESDLTLLQVLGVLDEPTNSLYFRSHIAGKVGIRPRLDVWLGIHKATDRQDNRLPLVKNPGLKMLHYESYSGEEFVRKWNAMVTSGPSIHFGPHRMRLATAVKALVGKDLPPGLATELLTRIYDDYMADPVDLLGGLGLLEEVDVYDGGRRPEALPDDERQRLRDLVEGLRGEDKWQFLPEQAGPAQVERVLDRVAGGSTTVEQRGIRGLRRRS